jgi:hypothetical protein
MRALALCACLWPGCVCYAAPERSLVVPAEAADDDALRVLADWEGMPVLQDGSYRRQSSEDRGRAGPPAQRIWENGNRDLNHFVCAGGGARVPTSPAPFVFDVEACAESYARGMVLGRFEGSGRLARIWLTQNSIRSAPADDEVLRIWVDDRPEPLVEAPLAAVLDGSAGEIFAPPFGAGSTRRLAWYYPLVFADKLVVALDGLGDGDLYFHQVDVVLDRERRPRRAAASRSPQRDRAKEALAAAVPAAGSPVAQRLSLAPSETVVTHELGGPATVVKARLRVARAALASLGDVVLDVRWDGVTAMSLPLVDLFGAAAVPPERSSPALGARSDGDAVELSLRLPMPFAETARWALTNVGKAAIDLELVLEVKDGVPAGRFGRLHAQRFETAAPASGPHRIASVAGAGRLVGVCASLRGHGMTEGRRAGHPMHFLEGDETIVVDGEITVGGTGTEDYFDGAFYFQDGPGATPFAQVWGVGRAGGEPPQAVAQACRWHVLGAAIDFGKSLAVDLEVGPGAPELLDAYRSVAFLYR